jgi:hypothetical protein
MLSDIIGQRVSISSARATVLVRDGCPEQALPAVKPDHDIVYHTDRKECSSGGHQRADRCAATCATRSRAIWQ